MPKWTDQTGRLLPSRAALTALLLATTAAAASAQSTPAPATDTARITESVPAPPPVTTPKVEAASPAATPGGDVKPEAKVDPVSPSKEPALDVAKDAKPSVSAPEQAKTGESATDAAAAKPAGNEVGKAADPARPAQPSTDTAVARPATDGAAATSATTDAKTDTKTDVKPSAATATVAVPAADQPVADKIKELLASKSLKTFDRGKERAAVEASYAARSYAPLWSEAGKPTARAREAMARLKQADFDGLDPADYPAPDFAGASTPDQLAEADLKLTATLLDYARHAENGRMHWSRVTADIAYPDHASDPADVLAKFVASKDMATTLDGYNPTHPGYKALKDKLAELRAAKGDLAANPIPTGPTLRFNKKQKDMVEDERVPRLRERLKLEAADDNRYDAKLAEAVRKFQAGNDLKATGVLDDATVKALNGPSRDKQIDTVLLNMERWRWLPRELGEPKLGNAYVILNIPDFTLRVMQHGKPVWTTRVVTGKPGKHATPMLTETMKFITVNPTWNVPPSIVYNEYLPVLQQDPNALARIGLRVTHNRDGSLHISQPPGERNALGRLRFNFPNKFLVYQHDTPDKHLFAHDTRAYSHGCMRVQHPDQYAEALLGIALPEEKYTVERIRRMYGSSEQNINFPTPIPVHITYQTAFVDDDGKLQIRRDIYGRDQQQTAVLRGDNKRLAEVAIEHSQPNYSRPPVRLRTADDEYYSGGPSFFERLFGGPPEPAPPPQRRRVYQR